MTEKKESQLEKAYKDEKEFLDIVKGDAHQVTSELDLLVKIYNIQLQQLVGLRVDLEYSDHLVIAEPNNNEHNQRRTQTKTNLRRKEAQIRVIRKQLAEMVKLIKHGKKD
jgi:hypothetical protein